MNSHTLSADDTLPAYENESTAVRDAHARWNGIAVADLAYMIAQNALKTTVIDKKVRHVVLDGVTERLAEFLDRIGIRRVRHYPSSDGVEAPPLRDGEEWRIAEHVAALRAAIDGRLLEAA